jgi:hypothetical protein
MAGEFSGRSWLQWNFLRWTKPARGLAVKKGSKEIEDL